MEWSLHPAWAGAALCAADTSVVISTTAGLASVDVKVLAA